MQIGKPLQRYLRVLMAGLGLAACTPFSLDPAPQAQIEQDADQLANDWEILVLFGSADSAASLVPKARRRGFHLNRRDVLDGLDLILLSFVKPENLTGEAAIRELEALEPGATAGVNHSFSWQASDAPGAQMSGADVPGDLVYANDLLDWPDEGCPAYGPVGMIDGPIDEAAPGLREAAIRTADFRSQKDRLADPTHATSVAELLVGPGRLMDAQLFVGVVVDVTADGTTGAGTGAIIRALNWLRNADVRIVNISLAGPYNKILDRAVQAAARAGVILVAAAGNDGATSPPRYPAAMRDVVSVTAVDRRLMVYEHAVRGGHIDFAAPGVDVFVQARGEGRFLSGTSIATPFVTSRLISTRELLDQRAIAGVLKHLSRESVDLGSPDHDDVFGHGLLKAPGDCSRHRSPATHRS